VRLKVGLLWLAFKKRAIQVDFFLGLVDFGQMILLSLFVHGILRSRRCHSDAVLVVFCVTG